MKELPKTGVVFAGIDGGGTRTRLALARGNGCVFGFAETGCCSFVELGLDRARLELEQLWKSAWQSANVSPRPADRLFIGTGSILSKADAEINCELAVSLGFASRENVQADNDACNALAGALEGRPGLLTISGTGSVCYGRNARGECWRAGGWGHLLHDTGSAYSLGLAAMIAATRAADGRGPATKLTAVVLESLEMRDLKEIYHKLHHVGVPRAGIAALAPRVAAAAEAGDGVANEILDAGADGLVEMILTVVGRLGLDRPEIAFTGGLITNARLFRQRVLARLVGKLSKFTLTETGHAPVFGAVLLACQNATGARPGAAFVENLRQSTANLKITV